MKFKDLYQVLPEHINIDYVEHKYISLVLFYNDLEFEIFNNAIEVRNTKERYDYLLTTFTNGIMFYDNNSQSKWWIISLGEINSKDDLFNLSVQQNIFDLDLDLIRYIENLMKLVRENLYYDNKFLKVKANGYE